MGTTATQTKKTDAEIQQQVLKELDWDPRVDETEVGVQVKKGVVVLTGRIDSYAKKLAASEAAHRVPGVLDVANDLEVSFQDATRPTDPDIAQAVRTALRWNVFVPDKAITSTVTKGWVTLEGTVEHWHQREHATSAVQELEGVAGVTNKIVVRTRSIDATRIRTTIEEALARQAEREAKRIHVQVQDGGVVTLGGVVRSWSEKMAIERSAGYSPGVVRVQNNLMVDSYS
jgi:osmotically-inducible protein OsmY